MESSPLNMAHQEDRKADILLNQKKFEESIRCHSNAIALLMESMKLTDNEKSTESLKLQKEYHAKQITLIQKKKTHHEIMKAKLMFNLKNPDFPIDFECVDADGTLKTMIFNNLIVQNYLINRLENSTLVNSDVDKSSLSDVAAICEELSTLNQKQQEHLKALFVQLDETETKIEDLKVRVKELEKENTHFSTCNFWGYDTKMADCEFYPCKGPFPVSSETESLPRDEIPKFEYNGDDEKRNDEAW